MIIESIERQTKSATRRGRLVEDQGGHQKPSILLERRPRGCGRSCGFLNRREEVVGAFAMSSLRHCRCGVGCSYHVG